MLLPINMTWLLWLHSCAGWDKCGLVSERKKAHMSSARNNLAAANTSPWEGHLQYRSEYGADVRHSIRVRVTFEGSGCVLQGVLCI